MSNFGSISTRMHDQHFQLTNIVDDYFTQTIREKMSNGLAGSITNLGHGKLAFKSASDAVIDTLGLSPCFFDRLEAVRLMSLEGFGSLLYNYQFLARSRHLFWVSLVLLKGQWDG
jgi:hypothetical protein